MAVSAAGACFETVAGESRGSVSLAPIKVIREFATQSYRRTRLSPGLGFLAVLFRGAAAPATEDRGERIKKGVDIAAQSLSRPARGAGRREHPGHSDGHEFR